MYMQKIKAIKTFNLEYKVAFIQWNECNCKNTEAQQGVIYEKILQFNLDFMLSTGGNYQETVNFLSQLSTYGGALGNYIQFVTGEVDWVENFRVGDSPTVFYLVDPNNDVNNPALGSWGGR